MIQTAAASRDSQVVSVTAPTAIQLCAVLYHLAFAADYDGDPLVHTTPSVRVPAASNNPRASNDAAIGGKS